MKFVSLEDLNRRFGVNENTGNSELHNSLLIGVKEHFKTKDQLSIGTMNLSPQEVYFLIDLYQKKENRVFSGWVKADTNLYNFLIYGVTKLSSGNVDSHSGHILESKYGAFVGHFLKEPLIKSIRNSIQTNEFSQIAIELDISNLLEQESKLTCQQPVADYLLKQFVAGYHDRGIRDLLASEKAVEVINKVDDSYYSVKVEYVNWIKEMMASQLFSPEKSYKCLMNLHLSEAHRKEVERFVRSKKGDDSGKSSLSRFNSILRNPLLYVGLVIIVVLIYILSPKDVNNPKKADGNLKNRSGLDSLTSDEIQKTDTLLGYTDDTMSVDIEGISSQIQPKVDFQILDKEDSIKNELVSALLNSMFNDFSIQSDQNDSDDCNTISNTDRLQFQMKGVRSIDDISTGKHHVFMNETNYELYIMLFDNLASGKVFGSYIPSNGKLSFNYKEGMRLVIYSGNDLTRFNPLMHKNGGYGSLKSAKRIDERFIAHFCSFDRINEALLNYDWMATGRGKKTILKKTSTDLTLDSQLFQR